MWEDYSNNYYEMSEVEELLKEFSDKLTEEQQDIFMQAAAYTEEFNKKISEENENRVLEELKAEGVNIVDVDDITPWQDATKDIIEESTKGNEELYQQILDFAN